MKFLCVCENCGFADEYSSYEVILGGFPHVECRNCGFWISAEF